MTKLPAYKPREIEKILLKNGFFVKRQTGSHRIFVHLKLENIVVLPIHSRSIPTGTLRSVIKQSGLPEEKFLKK